MHAIEFRCSTPLSLLVPTFMLRRRLWKCFSELAPECRGSVLDFGCGTKPYRELFVNAKEYVGLDIEESGHPAEKKYADIYYDGIKIPFPEDRFDAIFSSEVFEHVDDIGAVLSELLRVLKPGGTMIVSAPFAMLEHEVPYDFLRFSVYGLQRLIERSKMMRVTRIVRCGNAVETLAHLATWTVASYIPSPRQSIFHVVLESLMRVLFVVPLNLAGLVLGRIFRRDPLYIDAIIVAVKRKN